MWRKTDGPTFYPVGIFVRSKIGCICAIVWRPVSLKFSVTLTLTWVQIAWISMSSLCSQQKARGLDTLSRYFIRYILSVLGWTLFCRQSCLNSSWHIFNKVLETFLRDRSWHDGLMQLMQICQLRIRDGNRPLHHTKVLYLIEIPWLWRPFETSGLIVIFKKLLSC